MKTCENSKHVKTHENMWIHVNSLQLRGSNCWHFWSMTIRANNWQQGGMCKHAAADDEDDDDDDDDDEEAGD